MVIVHDKPKTSRKIDHVEADVTDIADLVRMEEGLTNDINQAIAHRERIRKAIQERMGEATLAKVNGVGKYTYNYKQAWRTSELLDEHRPLCVPFFSEKKVVEFDVKAFAAKHPQIARQYQTREFRTVSGDGKN